MVPKDDEFLSGCSLDAITVVNLYNILESRALASTYRGEVRMISARKTCKPVLVQRESKHVWNQPERSKENFLNQDAFVLFHVWEGQWEWRTSHFLFSWTSNLFGGQSSDFVLADPRDGK